jgi:hypothetical protein
MKKQNRSITVSKNKMIVSYHDTAKHFTYVIPKDSPTREINLFGKDFKGVKDNDIKKDIMFNTVDKRNPGNTVNFERRSRTESDCPSKVSAQLCEIRPLYPCLSLLLLLLLLLVLLVLL